MVHQTKDGMFRNIADHENGMRLAREARDRGEYATAWKHAQAYKLNALDLLELKLPEQYRPRGFHPGVPKATGNIRY